jgi:gliding motility-associated-like protein
MYTPFKQWLWRFALAVLLPSGWLCSQTVVYNNSTDVSIQPGLEVYIEGGLENADDGTIFNDGRLLIRDNLISNGNTPLFAGSDSGIVELYGNAFQTVGGRTPIRFNGLACTGTGDKIVNTPASVSNRLEINNLTVRLGTDILLSVLNGDPNAITQDPVSPGFIVTDSKNSALVRYMNQDAEYVFPVGGLVNTPRYRPVFIRPSGGDDSFTVRMVNQNPGFDGYQPGNHDKCLEDVNPNFYHVIMRKAGSAPVNVSFVHDTITDRTRETVVQWANNQWYEPQVPILVRPGLIAIQGYNDFSNPVFALANVIKPDSTPILHMPNAFTPNADGNNEKFEYILKNPLKEGFSFTVWDRWGGVVFKTEDPTQYWDGKHYQSGDWLPQGVYVYELKGKGEYRIEPYCNRPGYQLANPRIIDFNRRGTLTLFR